jgi:hypothetical protein
MVHWSSLFAWHYFEWPEYHMVEVTMYLHPDVLGPGAHATKVDPDFCRLYQTFYQMSPVTSATLPRIRLYAHSLRQ